MNNEQKTIANTKCEKNTITANSLISRGAHLWNILPNDLKMLTYLRYLEVRSNNGMGINAAATYVNMRL